MNQEQNEQIMQILAVSYRLYLLIVDLWTNKKHHLRCIRTFSGSF